MKIEILHEPKSENYTNHFSNTTRIKIEKLHELNLAFRTPRSVSEGFCYLGMYSYADADGNDVEGYSGA